MTLGFQWDLARQLERFEWLLAQLPRYADWGYGELHLHLEDAVEYPSLPGVARPGALSLRQLARLEAAAARAGIRLVPIVNLLGHTQYLLKVRRWRDLNELRAPDGSPLERGQICPLHPRTLEVAERLLRDVAPFCTAGKVHVGLDESYHLGRHPLSRVEIAAYGMAVHFARHAGRLHELARGHGLRLALWGDMLALLPEAIPLIPAGTVVYDWYYHPFGRLPRLEVRNFAEYDLAPALRRRGVEYWGCPMSGAFRHEPLPIFRERLANILSWWRRCRQVQAAGMLVSSWEPQRLAAELPQAVEAAAAGLWLEGEADPRRLFEGGCRRVFGARGTRAAAALWAADRRPFSGYARWEANARWDSAAAPGPLRPWRTEAAALRRLAAKGGLPPAAAASLRFRAYLAERDLFIRQSARAVWALRGGGPAQRSRLLAAQESAARKFGASLRRAKAAAQAMWNRTRDPRVKGDNRRALDADERRLRAWLAWLRACRLDPARAGTDSAMAGQSQLIFTARVSEPAMQKVVVEMRGPDGAWRELLGRFLIEFQAKAARPRARLRQEFSVPVPAPLGAPPPLRISVRGLGRARISRPILTDGRRSRCSAGSGSRLLGRPAPRRGWPDFDWQRNRQSWRLVFAP